MACSYQSPPYLTPLDVLQTSQQQTLADNNLENTQASVFKTISTSLFNKKYDVGLSV